MTDWMNPTRDMEAGRDAGRNDRQREIDDLEAECAAIAEALEKLRAGDLQAGIDILTPFA